MVRVAVFDCDGVMSLQTEYFSRAYAKKYGVDADTIEAFFRGDFAQALIGAADLKELIRRHNDTVWHWKGDVQGLLDMWFEEENVPNKGLLIVVAELRAQGVPCYLATNQEKYRARYLKDVMFPRVFDDVYASCELGTTKPSTQFFQKVLDKVAWGRPGIMPSEIAFFDDSEPSVMAAAAVGFNAHVYRDVRQVREVVGLAP